MRSIDKQGRLGHSKPRRKDIRLKEYDYTSNGYYFVTICTFGRKPRFHEHRETVRRTLLSLPNRFNGLGVDYHVLMPAHIHTIFTFDGVNVSLGEVVRAFKALVTRRCRDPEDQNPFWQRNYYEHVIRNQQALSKIRQYIQNHSSVERIDFGQFYE